MIPRELKRRADFAQRGSLPHHNEIAVDNQTRAAKHMLYDDAAYTASMPCAMTRQSGISHRRSRTDGKRRWEAQRRYHADPYGARTSAPAHGRRRQVDPASRSLVRIEGL